MNVAELAGKALNSTTPVPLKRTLSPPSLHTSLSVTDKALCLKSNFGKPDLQLLRILPETALMPALKSIQRNFHRPPNNSRQSSNHSSAPQPKAPVTLLEALPQQLVGQEVGAKGWDVSCKSEKGSSVEKKF